VGLSGCGFGWLRGELLLATGLARTFTGVELADPDPAAQQPPGLRGGSVACACVGGTVVFGAETLWVGPARRGFAVAVGMDSQASAHKQTALATAMRRDLRPQEGRPVT